MNEKKICFIICANDDLFFSECTRYIMRLDKPEDMEIELIEVRDAISMTSGYNEGMRSSDAKYKVYLHQDVFLRYKYFIWDLLKLFKADRKIGLIGLVGSPTLPSNGVMWYGERIGPGMDEIPLEEYRYCGNSDGYWEVEAVDGLLIATQYDIPWREDLFDGWDYYDISQSLEMKRAGYRAIVPRQRDQWYIHDDKVMTNLWNHDEYRRRFLKEYGNDMKEKPAKKAEYISATTVLIVTHNEKEQLKVCIRALKELGGIDNLQIVVIDNVSTDGTAEWLALQEGISYATVEKDDGGYGKIINTALSLFRIEGDVLLMSPEYIITPECLARMREGLYSEEKIGAIEPVTNINNYLVESLFGDYESATMFAKGETRSTTKSVVLLQEGIFLVRKEAIDLIGKLDEQFETDEVAILDYQLRMIEGGFRFKCVTNAVAYNIEQRGRNITAEILQEKDEGRRRLMDKWGMNYFNKRPSLELIHLVTEDADKDINVLEVGCDCGATLAEIKNRYPESKVYGYEINPSAAKIAAAVITVEVGNLEEQTFPYDKKMFDYIIFGDVLEHLRDPEAAIKYCSDYLKEGGCILASIPNLMHISVIKDLLSGNFSYGDTGLLDRTHIHMFTYNEIVRLFRKCDFEIEVMKTIHPYRLSEMENEYIQRLKVVVPDTPDFMFKAYQYLFRAKKKRKYNV